VKKLTPLKAIHAKCYDCGYDPSDKGSKQAQTEACTDTACALHEYRPLSGKTKKAIRAEKIRNFTPEEREAYKRKAQAAKLRFHS